MSGFDAEWQNARHRTKAWAIDKALDAVSARRNTDRKYVGPEGVVTVADLIVILEALGLDRYHHETSELDVIADVIVGATKLGDGYASRIGTALARAGFKIVKV